MEQYLIDSIQDEYKKNDYQLGWRLLTGPNAVIPAFAGVTTLRPE